MSDRIYFVHDTGPPGKYDRLSEQCAMAARAQLAVVMIVGGTAGNGFSVTGLPGLTQKLPALLREMADLIEATQNKG